MCWKQKVEVDLVASKPDIVALKWVVGLMNKQAENAEYCACRVQQQSR